MPKPRNPIRVACQKRYGQTTKVMRDRRARRPLEQARRVIREDSDNL